MTVPSTAHGPQATIDALTTSTVPSTSAASRTRSLSFVGTATPCTDARAPTGFARIYPDGEQLPVVPGTNIYRSGQRSAADALAMPDTDGDGTPDELLIGPGATAALRRHDGTIKFTSSDTRWNVTSVLPVGDLDGDGRDEVAVMERAAASTAGPALATWITAEALRPGDVDVATAAGLVVDAITLIGVPGVGTERVVLTGDLGLASAGSTRVVDRSELGAAVRGPSSAVGGWQLPGTFIGTVDTGTDRMVLATATAAEDGAVLRLGDAHTCQALTTRPRPWLVGYTRPVDDPEVIVGGAATTVTLMQNQRDGSWGYRWQLPGWTP